MEKTPPNPSTNGLEQGPPPHTTFFGGNQQRTRFVFLAVLAGGLVLFLLVTAVLVSLPRQGPVRAEGPIPPANATPGSAAPSRAPVPSWEAALDESLSGERWGQALMLVTERRRADPFDPAMLVLQTELAVRRRHPALARESCETLRLSHPDHALLPALESLVLAAEGRLDAAAQASLPIVWPEVPQRLADLIGRNVLSPSVEASLAAGDAAAALRLIPDDAARRSPSLASLRASLLAASEGGHGG